MGKRTGYRPADSYVSKDPGKRAKQLSNLRHGQQRNGHYQKVRAEKTASNENSKSDICHFAEKHFVLTDTRKPIVLCDWEHQIFVDLFSGPESKRPTLALLGMPKKSGKSTLAAIIALWYLLNKLLGEIYIMGPDLQQGQLVVFENICRAIRLHPYLRQICRVGKSTIECERTGAKITVLPCNKTAAGLNPDLVIFDELWQFTSLEARRAIDELCNIPEGIKHNLILVVTYAGYQSDEDSHLWRWYKMGMDIREGKLEPDPKFYFLWRTDYEDVPWVTKKYLASQRKRLRPNTYKRFHENAWTSGEESFIDAATLEVCMDKSHRKGFGYGGSIVCGLDVGPKHDCTALAAIGTTGDGKKLCLVDHVIFKPPEGQTLDLEKTFECHLLKWQIRYNILATLYDPYQAIRSAQRLTEDGLEMIEYPQTVQNLVKMSDTLQGLLKSSSLILYEDDEVRQNLLGCAVKETTRGWRIVKSNQARKIDLSIAIAMAAQGASELLINQVEPEIFEAGEYGGIEPYQYDGAL